MQIAFIIIVLILFGGLLYKEFTIGATVPQAFWLDCYLGCTSVTRRWLRWTSKSRH